MGKFNQLKLLAVFMVAMVATVVLAGCGPKVKPEESISILAKGLITLELADCEKVGMKKEDQAKLKEQATNIGKKQVQTMMQAIARVKLTDEQAGQIVNKIYETQKKTVVATKLISESGKDAVVELSITPFDTSEMESYLETLVQEKVKGLNQAQLKAKLGDIVTECYLASLDKVVLKSEPIVMQVKCKLNDNKEWLPAEDAVNFGFKVGQTIWGNA